MARRKTAIADDIMRRVRWLVIIFILAAIAIVVRMVWIQFGPEGEELRAQTRRITFERVETEAMRGDILASDGRLLATSVPTYEIRMDFAAKGLTDSLFRRDVDELAASLSKFFGDRSAASYRSMLVEARDEKNREKNRYKLISPRRVSYLEEREIRSFPIFREGANRGGYIKVQVNRRLKLHGSLAERTIGMVNQSGVKIGVEGAFDPYLSGTNGSTLMQRVSGNFRVPVPDAMNIEPVNGMDVVTTIDVDLQDVAETALKKQLELGNADWGTVVLMEVATGEIHAMSNITRKGPGRYSEDFNYAIGRRMEPGSTFKLATLIALLEDAGMSLDDMVDCENGRARVGARVVTDDHRESVISLRRVFEVSSNIGFAKAVHQHYGDNPARFVELIREMGPGKALGMQITGEQAPDIKHPDDKKRWDRTSLVMMSYGYALEITPMHTLMLYNAVANGGRMMRPRLVKEVRSYGRTVKQFPPEVANNAICSASTLALVRGCLEGVVEEGTGRALQNPYYTVAAKTGTAQVALESGGYITREGGRDYLATLVGYFPADEPKYTCIVAIKTYHGPGARNTYYGASLSGPVFRAIADRVYASNYRWHERVSSDEVATPSAADVKAGRADELGTIARHIEMGMPLPAPSADWVVPTAVRNEPEEGAVREIVTWSVIEPQDGTVPGVTGMGLRDALYLLESRGIKVTYEGRGRVRSQSLAAGTELRPGIAVHLVLR